VFHLNIKEVAFSAWVPYVGAALGSIAGGWYSGWLINRGHTVNYARKAAMLLGGIIIIPSILAAIMSTTAPVAIVFMALVLGGFQFFMTNLQTIPSDLHSGKSVGSLAGLGGIRYYPGNPFCQLYYELDIIIQSVGSFGAAIAVFHLPDSRRD
jgi:ACS family hexuronate transporter-like MFS transporter